MSNSAKTLDPNLKIFKPNYRQEAVTEKFYARHDRISADTPNQGNCLQYEDEIEKLRQFDSRFHFKVPRYTNQEYGWYPGYMIRFLQYCDLNLSKTSAMQEIAKQLVSQQIDEKQKLIDHCACRERRAKAVKWKIV